MDWIALGLSFVFSVAAFVYARRADGRAERAEKLATNADERAARGEAKEKVAARLLTLERISTTVHVMAHSHGEALGGGGMQAVSAGARQKARLIELLKIAPVALPACKELLAPSGPWPDYGAALAEVEAAIGAEQATLAS